MPGVQYLRSASVTGRSQGVLRFKMGTDLPEARQRVGERLKLAIAEVADVTLETTPNKIRRENNSRRLDAHGNVKGRDPAEALCASAWIPCSRE